MSIKFLVTKVTTVQRRMHRKKLTPKTFKINIQSVILNTMKYFMNDLNLL